MSFHKCQYTLIGLYNNLICCYHWNCMHFGHFIDDFLPALMLFPRNIISRGKIIVLSTKYSIFLKSLGIFESNIVYLDPLSKNLYRGKCVYFVMNPYVHCKHYGYLYRRVSVKIKKYFNLGKYKPHIYSIINRNKGDFRYIENIRAASRYVNKKFNFTEWILFDKISGQIAESVNDSAILWSKFRFVIIAAGSGSINSIFMHENTAMFFLASDIPNNDHTHLWDIYHCLNNMIWSYFVILYGVKHFSRKPVTVSLEILEYPILNLLYALKYNEWFRKSNLHFSPDIYTRNKEIIQVLRKKV